MNISPPADAKRAATTAPAPGAEPASDLPVRAWLSLGSNIAPERNLADALAALRARFGALLVSSAWRSAPVGFSGADFLNIAMGLDSDLPPLALRDWLHDLEARLGRDRRAPRLSSHTLDADLVLFGDQVLHTPELELPRRDLLQPWVLGPLAEIAPDLREPRSGQSLAALWAARGMGA
ncbi:MAG: 2-amino-4-hydroxy-6-hydroxymethyldihydropteridine diphosphokinase [Metallibacterium sp.]